MIIAKRIALLEAQYVPDNAVPHSFASLERPRQILLALHASMSGRVLQAHKTMLSVLFLTSQVKGHKSPHKKRTACAEVDSISDIQCRTSLAFPRNRKPDMTLHGKALQEDVSCNVDHTDGRPAVGNVQHQEKATQTEPDWTMHDIDVAFSRTKWQQAKAVVHSVSVSDQPASLAGTEQNINKVARMLIRIFTMQEALGSMWTKFQFVVQAYWQCIVQATCAMKITAHDIDAAPGMSGAVVLPPTNTKAIALAKLICALAISLIMMNICLTVLAIITRILVALFVLLAAMFAFRQDLVVRKLRGVVIGELWNSLKNVLSLMIQAKPKEQ